MALSPTEGRRFFLTTTVVEQPSFSVHLKEIEEIVVQVLRGAVCLFIGEMRMKKLI